MNSCSYLPFWLSKETRSVLALRPTAATPCRHGFLLYPGAGAVFGQRPLSWKVQDKSTWRDMMSTLIHKYIEVSWNGGTPKSSIQIGFSTINHSFWGTSIYGNPHMNVYHRDPYKKVRHDEQPKCTTHLDVYFPTPPHSIKLDLQLKGTSTSFALTGVIRNMRTFQVWSSADFANFSPAAVADSYKGKEQTTSASKDGKPNHDRT
jgi:hypothetical protein